MLASYAHLSEVFGDAPDVRVDVSWTTIENEIHRVWREDKKLPLETLSANLQKALRDLEYDQLTVSRVCATPLVNNGVIPSDVLHVILALVSDQDCDVGCVVGGKSMCSEMQQIALKAGVPSCIITKDNASWPIISLSYHMTQVVYKGPATILALGVRVNSNYQSLLDNLIIPGVCVFKSGFCVRIYEESPQGSCVSVKQEPQFIKPLVQETDANATHQE